VRQTGIGRQPGRQQIPELVLPGGCPHRPDEGLQRARIPRIDLESSFLIERGEGCPF
jgi:hypothetical protein